MQRKTLWGDAKSFWAPNTNPLVLVAPCSPTMSGGFPMEKLLALKSTIVGDTSDRELMYEWGPLAFVVLAPVLCLFVRLICCCEAKPKDGFKFGARTALRGVSIAIRADFRMGKMTKLTSLAKATTAAKMPASYNELGGFAKPTAAAMESGKAFDRARGTDIKVKAQAKSKNSPPGKK